MDMPLLVYSSIKVLLTAIIIVVSEIAKMNTVLGAIVKSLPLISLLAMMWLYVETWDVMRISSFSTNTFWFVLQILPLFLIFPALLRYGITFWLSLSVCLLMMLLCYGVTFFFIRYFNIQL